MPIVTVCSRRSGDNPALHTRQSQIIQVGQYPLLTFSFEDSQGHILQQLRLRDVNAQRAHLILTPEIQLAK